MNLTSWTTKFLVLLVAVCAFAFNGDDGSYYFYLTSNRIYSPGDTSISVEFSSSGLGNAMVKFRAFRVQDPVAFFIGQKDPHSPDLAALDPPNTFDMLKLGYQKVTRDARHAARTVIPYDRRMAIRDVADVNGVKAAKRRKGDEAATNLNQVDETDIPKGAEGFDIVASWNHKPAKNQEQWRYESVPIPVKAKGVYLIEARSRGKRAFTALVISEAGMVIKQGPSRTVAFISNRKTGKRITDFPLVFARNGERILDEETGSDGVVNVSVPPPPKDTATHEEEDWEWRHRRRRLLVVGEKDGDFVISDPYYYREPGSESYKVYLQTDRPVYRPAQTVYYRGIVRRVQEDGTYENVTGKKIYIEVTDARDNSIKKDTLTLSDLGIYNSSIELAEEPPLGTYTIRTSIEGAEEGSWDNFSVEEYKKPEYKVEVTTDKEQYTRGDVINATAKADYFFGSPVANADVEYFIFRARYWRPWWRGSEWAYLYEDSDEFSTYRMEMVHSGEGKLNADGTFTITYKTEKDADDDYVYRIQANVVDNSRRSIAGAKSVEVTRGEFYLSSRTDKYVYKPGDDAKITVAAATFDGDKPVAIPFDVKIVRTWWDRLGTRDNPEYKERTQVLWSGNGATDADGKGTVTYKPTEAGYFRVEIGATDKRGTRITESSYIYVADAKYANWYREGSGDVQIIPDKPSYQPGETISALVIMPAADIDALITAEGSTIYSHKIERLASNSAIVHFTVDARMAPVFYLTATALVNDQLYSESQRITVVPQGKMIRLDVTANKEIYKPGEKGTVMLRALDESGRPMRNVDVALAMVDEAVYSIQPESTPEIQRFFYGNRWNEVSTSSSLYFSFYGSGRTMRREARGTFSESMDQQMGGAGMAKADGAPPPAPMMANARNIAFGDVKGQMFVQPTVRKSFKDMMFWTPSVRTDENGYAKLDVTFPDNLTTWRITARGVTENTAVGQTVARVIARKDLLVRMETPRFLIEGDELLIATTVHNYLKENKIAKIELSGDNVLLKEKERTITIDANGEQRIDWRVTAPTTGAARLTVKALTNEESDAMEMSIPVMPRGLKITKGEAADLEAATGRTSMTLTIPETSDPATSSLSVNISPSLAGSIIGSLDELIGYPYGCVEQTMSRFLPTVVVAQTLQQLDVPFKDAAKQAEIPKMVASGLNRLYGMQHDDGGWGWWENDETDAFMTAYVIYGMTIARSAGHDVSPERYETGTRALAGLLENGTATPRDGSGSRKEALDVTTQAYMLYVMSQVNGGEAYTGIDAHIATLAKRDSMNNYSRALLALAAASRPTGRSIAQTLVGKLESSAKVNGAYASWQGKHWHYNWQDDQVETSAFAVKAILQVRGETDLVKKGVRWLLTQRQGDAWDNTRQTAMTIYSLIDYLRISNELSPSYTYTVSVNGSEVANGQMTGADVYKPERQVKVAGSALRRGANTITIEKSGDGKLYAASRVTYYATGAAIQPASAGFKVTREYYTLRKERKGDIYVYNKRPFSGTVKTGDEIFVRVKVTPDTRYEYFMLEDPLPAGCEVVTNTDGYTIPGEEEYDEAAREKRGYWGWYWWYADRDVRDEKVAFFAREIEARDHEFTYILRAQIPGSYSVMPSLATLMYYPEVRGNSGMISLKITE